MAHRFGWAGGCTGAVGGRGWPGAASASAGGSPGRGAEEWGCRGWSPALRWGRGGKGRWVLLIVVAVLLVVVVAGWVRADRAAAHTRPGGDGFLHHPL